MHTTRSAFTLIELLLVISIIALLITLLLPAIEGARDAVQVAGCANNQHQILIGLNAWGADNDGKLPPSSGYNAWNLNRGVRGSGDWFDQLVPEYVGSDPQLWYCPGGILFWHSGWNTGTPHSTVNTIWDFSDFSAGHCYLTQTVYCNLQERGGYTDIPRKLRDPSDWVLVNDRTSFSVSSDGYGVSNHPGRFTTWGKGQFVRGRNGLGAPRGINTGTVDGSVTWTPQGKCMLGYGRLLQPPRPGRPGYLPY